MLIDQADAAISPPLTLDALDEFRRVFYRRCLREDAEDDWIPSRSAPAWELTNWLVYLTSTPAGVARLSGWRDWLAEEYRAGDAAIRECLVTTVLRRLLTRPDVTPLFESWKRDDVLREAFAKVADVAD
jgi:hypothetical protein